MVSLAYRGKYYQNEMKRVAELSEALRPDWIFFDLELFPVSFCCGKGSIAV